MELNIGMYIQYPKGSLSSHGNVLGDELIGESMCRSLRKMSGVISCELYAPNFLPQRKLDVMIYLNENEQVAQWARCHVLYMQNAYPEGSEAVLRKYQQRHYDGYAFISNRLLDMHRQDGFEGLFLPFGVDVDEFYPRSPEDHYSLEIAYVGGDIKGKKRSMLYLYPALAFNFGLFGNWKLKHPFKFWKNSAYQRAFARIERGKIPQEDVPILYSSTRINLNCTAQDCVDWDVITLRTFEVLACKGFLISDRVAAAERDLKDCMVFTDGGDDLAEKIRYYLDHPEERRAIAENGYQYVIRHATIASRMDALLSYLKDLI